MARRYSTYGAGDTGTDKTVLTVVSTTAIRPAICDILLGAGTTPSDHACKWVMNRFTAGGTGTAFTPVALNPSDPAATFTSASNHTVEPTYTASSYLLGWSMNQRGTFRWVAAPGFELIAPNTAANGIGLKTLSSTSTADYEATFLVEE